MQSDFLTKLSTTAINTESTPACQPEIDSHTLFAGSNEVVIFHYGEAYRLRQTRQGKLILTK